MSKHRVRSKNAKKGFRWAKGQSSSSNPQKSKHRDAAKARVLAGFTHTPTNPAWSGPSKLTAESLLKHDVLMGEGVGSMDQDAEAMSLGQTAKTFETFASDWTQCTNPSFDRLLRKFNGNNAMDKEKLAILAAVTEVIKERGGEESSTEYFAALLTTLETIDTAEGLAATLSLLSLIIKTVPESVLQNQFSNVSKLLMENLTKYADSGNVAIVRALLGCLSVLLRAQSSFTWSQGSTLQIVLAIFSFCVSDKAKIRKAAQHCICAILRASVVITVENAPDFHPVSVQIAEQCLERLKYREEVVTILHTLNLLKEILPCFPALQVKMICDTSLKLLKIKLNPHVSTGVLQMLFSLFNAKPSTKILAVEANERILRELYNYKPSVNDAQPMIAWLTVMQEALINLASLNPNLCLAALPTFFDESKKCWSSDKRAVAVGATTALKAVCVECIEPEMKAFASDAKAKEIIRQVMGHIKDGLGYQYLKAWDQVLHLMSVFFDTAGKHVPDMASELLPSLAERRNAQSFAFTNELDYVVGKAVRNLGPRQVLSILDLQITGKEKDYDFPMSWLLPVLRENVRNTELAFFSDYFLPLAERCRERSNKCLNLDDKTGHKVYQVIEIQIWSLLPGFCNNATDVAASFNHLARTLGEQLRLRKDLRIDIMHSLRLLIQKSLENEESRKVLSSFAKNYLPILCNIYAGEEPVGSEEVGQRLAAFETIKEYSKIAPHDRLQEMFDKAFAVYTTSSGFKKEATLDILRSYVAFQDQERIGKLYNAVLTKLESKDHTEQKKAYKVLEDLCCSANENCKQFVLGVLKPDLPNNLQSILLKSLSKASPPSQNARLRCLLHVVKLLSGDGDDHKKFVKTIIPESVICVKAANSKAKEGAYTLIEVIAETLIKWSDDQEAAMVEFVGMLSAGLAGTPTMMSCTILAITRVFFSMQDLMPDHLKETMLTNVCHLLTCSTREVVGSSLSFLRVFVHVNPVQHTGKQEVLQKIVRSVMEMTDDCQRHFRLKTRYLLDRIVQKFGYDMVSAMVPKGDQIMHKRLKNIVKAQARKTKRKAAKEMDEDSDDDDDVFKVRSKQKTMEEILADSDVESDNDEASGQARSKPKKKKQQQQQKNTFIAEGDDDDDVMDFLDPSAAQKVTSVKPKRPNQNEAGGGGKRDKNGGFKLTKDGKLIIEDSDGEEIHDEDSDDDNEERRLGKAQDSDSEGGGDENSFRNLVSSASAARKRKAGGSIASSRRTAEPAMKYQAGGTGIHRPLKKDQNDYGSEYRAKKARGDVKVKGKPDPYAYVPLQKTALNKRKKAKFQGQYNNLVKAAKTGAQSGAKAKGRAALGQKMKAMKL